MSSCENTLVYLNEATSPVQSPPFIWEIPWASKLSVTLCKMGNTFLQCWEIKDRSNKSCQVFWYSCRGFWGWGWERHPKWGMQWRRQIARQAFQTLNWTGPRMFMQKTHDSALQPLDVPNVLQSENCMNMEIDFARASVNDPQSQGSPVFEAPWMCIFAGLITWRTELLLRSSLNPNSSVGDQYSLLCASLQ